MKKLGLLVTFLSLIQIIFADVSEDFQFAKKMYDDTLYEEAIGKFREITQKYPTSFEAEESQFYIGNSYIALQKYDDAIATFRHLIKAYPDSKLIPNAVYQLSESQFKNQDYESSAKNYQQLINNFPQSDFSILSLEKVIKSLQLSNQYDQAILTTQSILTHYADEPQIPEIYLLLADIYLEYNMSEQFELTIEKIIADFSSSDAKWVAMEKLVKYYQNKKQTEKAVELIQNNLSDLTPRKYEKNLILLYANILFENRNYQEAKGKFQDYFRRFDTEQNLDEVAYKIALTNFELKGFSEVQKNCSDFQTEFPESKFLPEILLLLAKNYVKQENFQKALQQLDIPNFTNASKVIQSNVLKLKAEIYEYQNLYEKSITSYLQLSQKYNEFIATDSCYFHIAKIYQKRLERYEQAINYYQMILNSYPETKLSQQIQFEMADCYQKMKVYDNSLKILQSAINKGNLSSEMENKIQENIQYLQKYKIKNKEIALENLMDSFIKYLGNKNESSTLVSIIKIYKNDLKEYEKAIKIFKQNKGLDNNPKFLLLKGETYQDLAKKIEYESQSKENTEIYYQKAKETFQKIVENFENSSESAYAEYYLISLNLMQLEKTSDEYIKKLTEYSSAFIEKYSTFPKIGNVYYELANALSISKGDEQKIINYLNQAIVLSHHENIKNSCRILLGDIYLKNESYQASQNQYGKIDEKTVHKNGNLLFNLAYVEMKLNHHSKSRDYYQHFIDNFKQHKKFWDGVENLANIYAELNQTEQAIFYFNMLSNERPSDTIFRTLRDLHRSIQQFDNAVDASLKIDEMTNGDKRILAEIYLEKGDKSLSILQYEKVIENETDIYQKLEDIGKLAEINFALSDYQAAVKNYKKILELTSDYEDRFSELTFLNWEQIAKKIVISFYRLKSRKDAEEYEKTFKALIRRKLETKSHLLLERGKYYSNLNKDKANKIFDEIIDDYSATNFADNAYFQQALISLQEQNFDIAIEKLKTIIEKYPNSELVNNAYLKLGSINFSQQNYEDALDYYNLVIQNDDQGNLAIQAIENFALTCKSMGEWLLAIEAYQMLLDRFGNPEIKPQTLFEIAYCYFRDKKYQKAKDLFSEILPKIVERSTKAEILYWIGESYFGLENYEKAIESFLKIVYNYGDFPEWDVNANIKIAISYEKLFKFDKARLFYTSVIKRYGIDSKWGKEAKKLLDNLP